MEKQQNSIEKNLNDLIVIVAHIKDNMATKDDIQGLKDNMATKDDIKNMATKDDIKNMATKDDISELSEEMNERFDKLEKRTREDVDALARDYLKLERRVVTIERR